MELNRILTAEEKAEIFEIVNSEHLKLNGNKKKATKSNFKKLWKPDNMAYQLMIALYDSEDKYEEKNEWFQQYLTDTDISVEEVKNKKSISYAKYIRRLRWKDEMIEELENKLDNVIEDNNLISKEDHKQEIKDIKEKYKFELEDKDDKIKKLEAQINLFDSRMKAKTETHAQIVKNYEEQIKSLQKEIL